ncbi:MAG: hypothetical protein KGL53_16320 [Elusimicrobia bacterium]|nr:hypothetical protein [Elusimicrobiota bacterium]
MFDYELKGKQVILLLADEVVTRLRPFGIDGSPLFGLVHSVERHGLWLDAPAFSVCPVDGKAPRPAAKGASCHAHVFIPGEAIVSAVAFPSGGEALADEGSLHHIGFATPAPDSAESNRR